MELQGGKLVIWEVEILLDVKARQVVEEPAGGQGGERKQRCLGRCRGGQEERPPTLRTCRTVLNKE